MSAAERLKDIRKRVEAATAGPWELIGGGEYVTGAAILVAPDDGGVTGNDAEFIAHARTDLPRLLDFTEALMELVDDKADYAQMLWEKPHSGSDVDEASAIKEMVRQIRELADDALEGK